MCEPILTLKGVKKQFGQRAILKGIDLAIKPGTVTCLIGASGSGKTTLLRCLNRLAREDAGEIRFHGQLIPTQGAALRQYCARVGMVFQGFHLFSNLSVWDNCVVAPRAVLACPDEVCERRAQAALERVGMAAYAQAKPHQLSGGQKQRVAIARALCMEPEVLLFDEPTSALDPQRVGEVLNVMQGLAAQGQTLVVVTHEMGFVRAVADEVVFLHEGQIVEQGSPEAVLEHPKHPATQAFLAGGVGLL